MLCNHLELRFYDIKHPGFLVMSVGHSGSAPDVNETVILPSGCARVLCRRWIYDESTTTCKIIIEFEPQND